MKTKLSLGVVSVIAVLTVAILIFAGCSTQPTSQTISPPIQQPTPEPNSDEYTVEITSEGFNPSTITVEAGETVTWVNKNSVAHWVASANHPDHKVYPESGGCIGSKFDACRGIEPGESWSFTFNQKGSWGYHDHINFKAPFFGKVIVE